MSAFIPVSGIGAVTPVGLSAAASCAALRAGINRLGPVASYQVDDERGDPVPLTGGRVPTEWFRGGPESEEWPGHERFEAPVPPPRHLLIPDGPHRLEELAAHAAVEAWDSTGHGSPPVAHYGLFLGLDDHDEKEPVVDAVTAAIGWRPQVIDVVTLGRASALAALHRAALALAGGHISGAIVGGVDSLIRGATVDRLIEDGRMKDDEHPQGILPGEAAAFLVLERQPARTVAMLIGSGIGEEPTAGTDRPNQGVGLTAAVRMAREAAPAMPFRPLVVCDLNGDRYRAMEWGLTVVRALGDLRRPNGGPDVDEVWHPADCIGDCGAASGTLDAVWAIEAMRKGYANSDRALIWGASDGRLRAAVILERPAGSA